MVCCIIIPTSHHYAYFAQIDWLEKTFYTKIPWAGISELFSFRQLLKCIIMSTKICFYDAVGNYKEWIIIFVDFIDV